MDGTSRNLQPPCKQHTESVVRATTLGRSGDSRAPALAVPTDKLASPSARRDSHADPAHASTLRLRRNKFVTETSRTRYTFRAMLSNMTTKTATPWGPATLVEELSVPQRSGEKRFSSIVQLLEGPKGERLVRFAYSTGGVARRGPVTLRARDLERLAQGLSGCPQLAETLQFDGVKE